ncbi:tetratricopeptide repeat protein [Candidatus Woesearchaeota archaeon]|nr:tetratricopeptide repeat protein [Candidatus Woesearchaeota archaeon]
MTKERFIAEVEALMRADKIETAIEQIEHSPYLMDYAVLNHLALAYVQVGKCQEGFTMFSEILHSDADEETKKYASLNLAIILKEHGELDKAETIIRKLVQMSDTDPTYRAELAEVLSLKDDYDGAEYFYHAAYKRMKFLGDEDSMLENKKNICLGIGNFYKEKGRVAKAIGYFEEALRYKPLSKDAIIFLADCYFERSLYKDAKMHYEKAKMYYNDDVRVKSYCLRMLDLINKG